MNHSAQRALSAALPHTTDEANLTRSLARLCEKKHASKPNRSPPIEDRTWLVSVVVRSRRRVRALRPIALEQLSRLTVDPNSPISGVTPPACFAPVCHTGHRAFSSPCNTHTQTHSLAPPHNSICPLSAKAEGARREGPFGVEPLPL